MNATEFITGILGGGLVLLIPVIMKAVKDWREGKIAREDTAIHRWKVIAERQEASAERAWFIVGKYRTEYAKLWAAYVGVTGDRETFPLDPSIAHDAEVPTSE